MSILCSVRRKFWWIHPQRPQSSPRFFFFYSCWGGGVLNKGLSLLCATWVPNVNRPCTTTSIDGPLLKRHRCDRLRNPWFGESLGLQLVMVGSMASVQVPRNLDICTRLIAPASNASRKLTLFRTNWASRWVSGKPRLRSFQKWAVDVPLLAGGGGLADTTGSCITSSCSAACKHKACWPRLAMTRSNNRLRTWTA